MTTNNENQYILSQEKEIDEYGELKEDLDIQLNLNKRITLGKEIIEKLGSHYQLFLRYEELACESEGLIFRKLKNG